MDLPTIKTTTVNREEDQGIVVTYKNKQTLNFDAKAVKVGIADLVRKVSVRWRREEGREGEERGETRC